jgi:cellobiose-specific phosphotransferase system component IIB
LYNDTELRALLSKFKNYLLEVTENPELLKNEMKREEGKQYLDRLREQTQKQNYRKRLDDLYYNLNVMLEHVQNDATTKDFQMRLEKFTKDFVMNKEGKPDVYVLGNSVDQLRVMMGPILKKYLENIPIDRIDIISDNYDLRIEDVKISGADILPHYMDFRMDNKVHLDLKDTDLNVSRARLIAYIHHIKPQFKDVKFQYRRKSFPKIDDFGMCNLSFTGDGASLKLVWEIRSVPGKPTTAVLLENRCRIDSISIEINSSQTKHSLLDRMMAVLLQQRIKHEICRSVEDYLNNNIGVVNDQINSFFTQNPWEAVKEKATKQIFETIKQLPLNV